MHNTIKGRIQHDSPDLEDFPINIGGEARQTNPAAVSDRDLVRARFDDLGRQVMRPYQVRDLIKTAYVSLTGGTKTSLISGVTDAYLDLMQITASNQSDAATTLTVTDESTTVLSLELEADKTKTYNFPIPKKQSATGVAWYVDIPDISGTTVEISADFLQEV